MRNCRAFTLIEIAISVFILMLLMMLAVPSLNGVLADRRLHRTYDEFNQLAQQAQQLSMEQRRPYLLIWQRGQIIFAARKFRQGRGKKTDRGFAVRKGEAFALKLPASADEGSSAGMDFLAIGKLRTGDC